MTHMTKIAQQKLTTTGGSVTSEQDAPMTELERQIATIWQEVLGVPQVGAHDNFFDLGGSSLLALELFDQIEEMFAKKLPLATLYRAATVKKLANILQQEEQSVSYSSLVAIQPNGCKPPLFGIHEVNGKILFYRDLARYLGPDQPFYGLQAQGLDGKQAPLTGIEDMAAHYIKEIRTLQPKGPYFLAGFSLGGLLVFEMAQQLHRQGQKVALAVLFDTYTPGGLKRLPFPKRLSRHLSNFLQVGPSYILLRIKWLHKITRKFYPMIERPLSEDPRQLPVVMANRQAAKNYVLQVYSGRLTFFRAMDLAAFGGWEYDPYLCWGKQAAGGLEVYEVSGDHASMFREPHVKILAEKLSVCLDKAQADTSNNKDC